MKNSIKIQDLGDGPVKLQLVLNYKSFRTLMNALKNDTTPAGIKLYEEFLYTYFNLG